MTNSSSPIDSAYDLTIQDVGTAYFAPDTTPTAVSDAYNTQIQNLINAYNTYITDSQNGTTPDFSTLYSDIYSARQSLINMAQDGVALGATVASPPGSSLNVGVNGTGYLNQQMAQALNTLLQTLDIAGLNQSPSTISASQQQAAVGSWLDLSTAGLANYLSQASVAAQSGQSIQAMIDLEYVQAGNELISNQLGGLETALNYTQSAVNILTTLQNIMNAASTGTLTYTDLSGANTYQLNPALPSSRQPSPGDPVGGALNTTNDIDNTGNIGNDYVSNYQVAGASAFNSPLPVVSKATTAQAEEFANLASATGPLYHLISELLPQYGITTDVADTFGLTTGSIPSALNGTLAGTLFQVYYDMNHGAGGNVNNWIMDHMGAGSDYNLALQGDYSVNLTTAQTSAESLNSQQSQNVQQTLFLFQEFYQSGSGMLTQINQIIQAMAQQAGQ
jgi:hypothetical protein